VDVEFLKKKTNKIKNSVLTNLNNRKKMHVIYNFDEFLQKPVNELYAKTNKKALISYLVLPLIPPASKRDRSTFSNAGIAQYIPRALNELGYSVDIINYDNREFVPDKKYDVFFGHGGINFEPVVNHLNPSCIKIYFSTGTYWEEWNRAEKIRRIALQERKGVLLPPDRLIEQDEEFANAHADGIICLGNDHAKDTYNKFPRVININNAVFPDICSISEKNYKDGRNNFLFYNGAGNVHKGLDLLLEAFTQLKQHLYIRQTIEPEFFKIYEKELTEYSNIHIVPYLKKPSREFFSLMDTCNYVISPSCAEGQPGSIIEGMANGLIPILSKEANIDTKNFGITLKENSVDEIISIVQTVSQKPDSWYISKSSLTLEEVKKYYTPEIFLNNMKNAILMIIKEPL
jgi:hypothetical protein